MAHCIILFYGYTLNTFCTCGLSNVLCVPPISIINISILMIRGVYNILYLCVYYIVFTYQNKKKLARDRIKKKKTITVYYIYVNLPFFDCGRDNEVAYTRILATCTADDILIPYLLYYIRIIIIVIISINE